MITHHHRHSGTGIVNSVINKLPFEAHIPGYQYCGPGTKLQKRLARGDPGINALDAACKQHDIAYSRSNNLVDRHRADKILQETAWSRIKSKDASLGEKAASWLVTNSMKAKRKFGMGYKRKRCIKRVRKVKKGGLLPALIPFLPLIGKALLTGALSGAASYGVKKALTGGKGLYLKPYKRGGGGHSKKRRKKKH